jgi:cephalosporin hydroxylase
MFPFWDLAIAPVFDAVRAKRVVEIGALRGETTVLMLERLGPDAELHVIDPVPEFDPAEHERAFPGRYHFHRDLSLNVLGGLPPVDVALVDGDHNWYTVYHELILLRDTARAAGSPLPVLILHDVGWPYGRRDLYYAPETIPEAFRQPYAQRGIRIGRKQLVPRSGGLNPTMFNAVREGGPRNGVMTALEDFLAEHDEPVRTVLLPIYFGLAIVVEERRLDREPELARVLDRLESADGRAELLVLAEDTRLRAMVFQHEMLYPRERQLDRAATRYLELLKGVLLDEHYLDNELRIDLLAKAIERGEAPDPEKLRDPHRRMRPELRELEAARRAGRPRPAHDGTPAYFPLTTMGRLQLDHLEECLDAVRTERIDGDLVECGTGRGGGAIFLRGYLAAHEMTDRSVWVVDEFRSTTADDEPTTGTAADAAFPNLRGDLNTVREAFHRLELLDDQVRFVQGDLRTTLPRDAPETIALLRIGAGLGAVAGDVLDRLNPRVTIGGYAIVDGYVTDPECRAAVDAFRDRSDVEFTLVGATAVALRKRSDTVHATSGGVAATADPSARIPLARAVPGDGPRLSVVVVFYNMRREAERTLRSLTRDYQQGIGDLPYEVIAVENGSRADQRLGDDFVRSFGPEFRYVDLGADATPSPVGALNRGIELSTGDTLALMIDGAHVLTPGVFRYALQGIDNYATAIVAVQQWYVGPGQQGDAMIAGYDEAFEDELFAEIDWPTNGYRLFEVGQFVGDRDWFDGLWESNCMFVPRRVLEQSGCFDERFTVAGGGYANLELYERLGNSPDVNMVSLLGEGSFHQVHGGTTTNQTEADERRRRIGSYAQHYQELRGRPFKGPGKPIHYVGAMRPAALRTKARHRAAPNLFRRGGEDPDGLPTVATPIPEALRTEFVDAFWRSLAWQTTSWLGHVTTNAPNDLLAYQEILVECRPDWVVETGTGRGGRALFLATVCDALDHGRVISIDPQADPHRPVHPRITYVLGAPASPEIVEQVGRLAGDAPRAVVILGLRGRKRRIAEQFAAYERFVPPGSYVVVEQTVVNGHPVWPSHGPGPLEFVKDVLNTRDDFSPDPTRERFGTSLSPTGFLKRLR